MCLGQPFIMAVRCLYGGLFVDEIRYSVAFYYAVIDLD